MTYYLGKVGRVGARLVSSCKDLYNDVNAAYLTGATDVVVVKQKDGSLKSTPFHVRFGKLGVLRTGDLKEVEIEVNGVTIDLTMNINETGKVFFSPHVNKEHVSDKDHDNEAAKQCDQDAKSCDEATKSHDEAMEDDTKSHDEAMRSHDEAVQSEDYLHKQHSKPIFIRSHDYRSSDGDDLVSSGHRSSSIMDESTMSSSAPANPNMVMDMNIEIISSSFSDTLEVLSDSAIETEKDIEQLEGADDFSVALSDSEVDRHSHEYWKRNTSTSPRGRQSSKGKFSSETLTSVYNEEDIKERLIYHGPETSTANVDRRGFWSALIGMVKRKHQHNEDGIYLEDIDYESMDPDELSKFFPSSFVSGEITGGPFVVDPMNSSGIGSSVVESSPTSSLSPSLSYADFQKETSSPKEPQDVSSRENLPQNHILHQEGSPREDLPPQGGGLVASKETGEEFPLKASSGENTKENLQQVVSTLDGITFSLCGGLANGSVTQASFEKSLVTFDTFCSNSASILSNPNLVVRVKGQYSSWQEAAPRIMSAIVFLQILPQSTQNKAAEKNQPKKQSFWNFWGSTPSQDNSSVVIERAKSEGATPINSPRKWTQERDQLSLVEEVRGHLESGVKVQEDGTRVGGQEPRSSGVRREILSSDEEGYVADSAGQVRPRQRSIRRKKIAFTNILTSDQLASLSLQPGANKVVFSITTKYQGTAKANCTVYLWDYCDKIVVSDIDGTITRSDVAGQVLPLLGMDWTQNGVVELFEAISNNGYKIVYLSARAIGQAGYTKEFLRKVKRGSTSLPDGPLFLFPFSLYKAFRKEVIERIPEEFKIDCLKQINALFPDHFTPMYAGFGNKHNDVKSYMNVGIPESRIFTVNHKGILKHELSLTFQSSYMHLTEIVDRQFPPVRIRFPSICKDPSCEEEDPKEEYSNFNYWRIPLTYELPPEFQAPPSSSSSS